MIDIKFGYLFPWPVRLVAAVCLLISLGIFQTSIIGALILSLISFMVLISSEGTEVNVTNNSLREYNSFLVLKTGGFRSFSQPEKIFVTRGKESQRVHTAHTNHSAVFESVVYNGYLKLLSGEKIHLMREKDKDRLIKRLNPLSEGLKVEIVDHS